MSSAGQPVQPRGAVLLVSFPHQLPHALAAFLHRTRTDPTGGDGTATVFVWSYTPRDHAYLSRVRALLADLLSPFPHVRLVMPGLAARIAHLSARRSIPYRSAWLSERFRGQEFGAVYFAHDASTDRTSQCLMQAFPQALRVCYGDPPGFTYPIFDQGSPRPLRRLGLSGMLRRTSSRALKDFPLAADLNLVAIDMNGMALPASSSVIPTRSLPKECLLEVIEKLHGAAQTHGATELYGFGEREHVYLLLMSNFSKSGLATKAMELAMYEQICTEHVPPGGYLLIKGHYGSSRELVGRLAARIRGLRVRTLGMRTQMLPVELLPELVFHSTILSVSSASAFLKHLYSAEVRHVLTDELIENYFLAEKITAMRQANDLIIAQLGMDVVSSHMPIQTGGIEK